MKLLLWFPNPKDFPYLVAEVSYPKKKGLIYMTPLETE